MSDLLIPRGKVETLVHCRFGGAFIFIEEVRQWFIENDFEYECFNELTITDILFVLRAPDDILVAFKLRWL